MQTRKISELANLPFRDRQANFLSVRETQIYLDQRAALNWRGSMSITGCMRK